VRHKKRSSDRFANVGKRLFKGNTQMRISSSAKVTMAGLARTLVSRLADEVQAILTLSKRVTATAREVDAAAAFLRLPEHVVGAVRKQSVEPRTRIVKGQKKLVRYAGVSLRAFDSMLRTRTGAGCQRVSRTATVRMGQYFEYLMETLVRSSVLKVKTGKHTVKPKHIQQVLSNRSGFTGRQCKKTDVPEGLVVYQGEEAWGPTFANLIVPSDK
jgi:histone H3/H4